MIITSVDQLDPNKTYSYANYLNWQLGEYVELIKGKVFRMLPTPSASHQKVSRNLPPEKKKGFSHICPDFVTELKSSSNSFGYLNNKMKEWLDSGCQTAWLIDLEEKKCVVYRQGQTPETITMPNNMRTNDVLPGFVLTWDAIGL